MTLYRVAVFAEGFHYQIVDADDETAAKDMARANPEWGGDWTPFTVIDAIAVPFTSDSETTHFWDVKHTDQLS